MSRDGRESSRDSAIAMKRSRLISSCCSSKNSGVVGEQHEKSRRPALDENRGAHNKYDARPRPFSNVHHHHPTSSKTGGSSRQQQANNTDIAELSGTLPGMVVGTSNNHQAPPHRSSLATELSIHSHSSDFKPVINKREKARKRLFNNLRKARDIISDRTTTPSSAVSQHIQGSGTNSVNTQPTYRPPQSVSVDKFNVIKIKAGIDKKPTTIDEKSTAVLKYRTPHFR